MIGSLFIFSALALQQKQSPVPTESVEHKFLVAKFVEHERLTLAKAKASSDLSYAAYEQMMQELNAAGDLILEQIGHVDECTKLYKKTIDKKTSDLTVRETTAVKACQAFDLYPLRMPAKARKQP